MKFWQAIPWCEPEQMVAVAKIAENCGFEGVMTADHPFFPRELGSPYPYSADGSAPIDEHSPYPDVWVSTMAMAAATTTLKFTCGVYVLPVRHPVEVAKATAALKLYSGDRFILGAGLGWMKEEYAAYGVGWARRGKRMDEYLEVLSRLWAGGWAEYHGEFYDIDPLCINPAAPGGAVPVFLGGASAAALARAARCDGWIGAGNTPQEVPAVLARLRQHRQAAGLDWAGYETVIGLSTPPELDTFKRLADAGMSAGVNYPFRFALGERSSLDDKRRYMETFAESFIQKMPA